MVARYKDQPLIRAHDLMVGFGTQTVLDHLSIDLRPGEILGVVGASGAGKSVLLRTIIGLIAKQHGSIEIMGTDLDSASGEDMCAIARRWGILF
jgi:phospholipid/cholesterol/gamma-HCH transport system ATP-binding protein